MKTCEEADLLYAVRLRAVPREVDDSDKAILFERAHRERAGQFLWARVYGKGGFQAMPAEQIERAGALADGVQVSSIRVSFGETQIEERTQRFLGGRGRGPYGRGIHIVYRIYRLTGSCQGWAMQAYN